MRIRSEVMAPLLVATTNQHKLAEITAILAPLGVIADGLDSVNLPDGRSAAELPEPVEDADTFAGNAAIKAAYYAMRTSRPCLADDSGLEVDSLHGAPGVLSARYARSAGDRTERDVANIEKLLCELADVQREQRAARFVCAMCLASPAGAILASSRGELAGIITRSPRGANGFGYDPILELPDGRTSAQLSPDEKNTLSHRAAATRAIAPALIESFDRLRGS